MIVIIIWINKNLKKLLKKFKLEKIKTKWKSRKKINRNQEVKHLFKKVNLIRFDDNLIYLKFNL